MPSSGRWRSGALDTNAHPVPGHWRVAVRGRPLGLVSISDAFLDGQQAAADLFARLGMLTGRIDLREVVLAWPVAITRAV